ncbi:hypothetical protein AB0I54_42185 [Streptomyces sp. NPDC050625]|uniref:hypothetical protein n=1 Tax=Streptomyces sp. NPDC050625 TaxID=3154629 RepID=UPI0034451825
MPSIMALPVVADDTEKPQLPMRPTPHERDGRQPSDPGGRPHSQRDARVDGQIGPRAVGAIYQTSVSAYEVLAVIRDPERASALLKRCALWAVIVRDITRADSEPYAVGDTWTTSDYLVRAGRTPESFATAA